MSKNSAKKTVKQLKNWTNNELNYKKGKKIGRTQWEKRNKG